MRVLVSFNFYFPSSYTFTTRNETKIMENKNCTKTKSEPQLSYLQTLRIKEWVITTQRRAKLKRARKRGLAETTNPRNPVFGTLFSRPHAFCIFLFHCRGAWNRRGPLCSSNFSVSESIRHILSLILNTLRQKCWDPCTHSPSLPFVML